MPQADRGNNAQQEPRPCSTSNVVPCCATSYPPPTNLDLPGMLWLSPVAAAADGPPHGPARGPPPADVSPPPGAVPVALPSAVLEVGREPV